MSQSSLPGPLVVTGFEPFGPYSYNPSQQLVETLSEDADLYRWQGRVLPVSASALPAHLDEIWELRPRAIVALGLADCLAIRLERVAVNLADFRIPDNSDEQLQGASILADGPDAYFSTLPMEELRNELLEHGIPAVLSNTAGTYLCNMLLYLLLHQAQQEASFMPAGFVHIPQTPAMVAQRLLENPSQPSPSMSLETQRTALKVILKQVEDFVLSEESTHD